MTIESNVKDYIMQDVDRLKKKKNKINAKILQNIDPFLMTLNSSE